MELFQIAILTNKVQESEKTVNDLKQQYIHSQTDLQHHLVSLVLRSPISFNQ